MTGSDFTEVSGMRRSILLSIHTVAVLACCTSAQVAISYRPTTLQVGVATELTITLTDESGSGLGITTVAFLFQPPEGLTLDGFAWAGQLAGAGWFSVDMLPGPQTSAFGAGVLIDPNESLDVAVVTVTASMSLAAVQNMELPVLPEGELAALITGSTLESLDITAGRNAVLTVAGSVDDQIDDGGGDNQGGGGGDTEPTDSDQGGTDADSDDDSDTGDDAGDGPMDGDGEGDTATEPGSEDTAGDSPDDATGNGDGADDGGADIDGQTIDGQDHPADTSGGGDEDTSNDDGNDTAPGILSICGIGMIGPGLFTLAFLSVMKLHRRRVW